jgi:hypothetical protein
MEFMSVGQRFSLIYMGKERKIWRILELKNLPLNSDLMLTI